MLYPAGYILKEDKSLSIFLHKQQHYVEFCVITLDTASLNVKASTSSTM